MSHLFGPCELPECENEILTFSRFSGLSVDGIKVSYRNYVFAFCFLVILRSLDFMTL